MSKTKVRRSAVARTARPTGPPNRGAESSGATTQALAIVGCALVALTVGFSPFGVGQATDLPLLSLGLTALAAAVLWSSARTGSALTSWRVAWAGGAWLGWALLASLTSHRIASALFGVPESMLGWLAVASVCVAAFLGASRTSALRAALGVVAPWVLAGEGAFAVFQSVAGRHPGGSLSNSSYLGLIVVMLLPIAASVVRDAHEPVWRRALACGAAGVGLLALALGDARAALLGAASYVVVLLAAGFGARRGWSPARAGAAAAGTVAALTAVGLAVMSAFGKMVILAGFLTDRWRLWAPALRAIGTRPFLGFGPDGYNAGIYAFASRRALNQDGGFEQLSPDPHNVVLWVAVSTGVVGLLLLGWMAFEIARNWRVQSRAGEGARVAPFAAGVALYGIVVLTTPAAVQTLPLFALTLAASLRVEARQDAKVPRAFGYVVRWTVVAVATLTVLLALTRLSIGRVDRPGLGNPRRTASLAALWHIDPFLYYRASIDWGYEAQRDSTLAATRPDLAAIQHAVALEPANPVYRTELARTLGFYGEPPAAVEAAFRKALALFPSSPDAHGGYAEHLISQGRMQEAGVVLREGLAQAQTIELLRLAVDYYGRTGDTAAAARYQGVVTSLEQRAREAGYE